MNRLCCFLSNDPQVSSNTIKAVVKSRFTTFCMSYFVSVVCIRLLKQYAMGQNFGTNLFFLIEAKVLKHLDLWYFRRVKRKVLHFSYRWKIHTFSLVNCLTKSFSRCGFPLFVYVRSNIRPNVDARVEMCVFVLFVIFA